MLEINKESYDQLIAEKRYVDAGTLLLVALVGKNIEEYQLIGPKKILLTAICYNELAYSLRNKSESEKYEVIFESQMNFLKEKADEVLFKIKLTMSDFQIPTKKSIGYPDPRSIIADSILNFYKKINSPHVKFNPQESLIPDLFDKIVNQGLGIVRMLNLGLNSEAFGSWRTFHESIAITKILIAGGIPLKDSYLKHIVFSNAFRDGIEDEEEKNRVFELMKAEMKNFGLKSKDMKKFIEYGWLFDFAGFKRDDPSYKLNFRDGIQRCAGLSDYSEWYEAASELSHGSAIFFYSNDKYFQDLTLHGFYDMLCIFSRMFTAFYAEEVQKLSAPETKMLKTLLRESEEMKEEQRVYFDKKYFGE